MKRRSFLSLLGIGFCTTVLPTNKSELPDKYIKVLKAGNCPKCNYPMYIPTPHVLNKYIRHKYTGVKFDCKCPKCKYKTTDEIWCILSPKVVSLPIGD